MSRSISFVKLKNSTATTINHLFGCTTLEIVRSFYWMTFLALFVFNALQSSRNAFSLFVELFFFFLLLFSFLGIYFVLCSVVGQYSFICIFFGGAVK